MISCLIFHLAAGFRSFAFLSDLVYPGENSAKGQTYNADAAFPFFMWNPSDGVHALFER